MLFRSDLRINQQTPTGNPVLSSNAPPYINPTSPNPHLQAAQGGETFDFNQFNWQPGSGGAPGNVGNGFAGEGEMNFGDFSGQGMVGPTGEEGDFLPMVFQWDLADIWGGQNGLGGMGGDGMGF